MGYSIRKGMVEENKEFLQSLQMKISKGESYFLRVDAERISAVVYRLHNILKAANVLINECGGVFKDLRSQVQIKINYERLWVELRPVSRLTGKSILQSATPVEPGEGDMLAMLQQSENTGMITLQFKPSINFNLQQFSFDCVEIGFKLQTKPDTGEVVMIEGEGGDVMMLAQRFEKKAGAFDFLNSPEG